MKKLKACFAVVVFLLYFFVSWFHLWIHFSELSSVNPFWKHANALVIMHAYILWFINNTHTHTHKRQSTWKTLIILAEHRDTLHKSNLLKCTGFPINWGYKFQVSDTLYPLQRNIVYMDYIYIAYMFQFTQVITFKKCNEFITGCKFGTTLYLRQQFKV